MDREDEIRAKATQFLQEELQEEGTRMTIEITGIRHQPTKSVVGFIVKTQEADQDIESMTGDIEFDLSTGTCAFAGLDPFAN